MSFKDNFFSFICWSKKNQTAQSKTMVDSFDSADQDLVIIGLRDGITIVTDDRDLFNQDTILKLPAF